DLSRARSRIAWSGRLRQPYFVKELARGEEFARSPRLMHLARKSVLTLRSSLGAGGTLVYKAHGRSDARAVPAARTFDLPGHAVPCRVTSAGPASRPGAGCTGQRPPRVDPALPMGTPPTWQLPRGGAAPRQVRPSRRMSRAGVRPGRGDAPHPLSRLS